MPIAEIAGAAAGFAIMAVCFHIAIQAIGDTEQAPLPLRPSRSEMLKRYAVATACTAIGGAGGALWLITLIAMVSAK